MKKNVLKFWVCFLIFHCFFAISHFFLPWAKIPSDTPLSAQNKNKIKSSNHREAEGRRSFVSPCPPIVWGSETKRAHLFCARCLYQIKGRHQNALRLTDLFTQLEINPFTMDHRKFRCQWADVSWDQVCWWSERGPGVSTSTWEAALPTVYKTLKEQMRHIQRNHSVLFNTK